MSSIFLFARDQLKDGHSVSHIQIELNEKLKDFSDQIKKDGVSIPDVLRPLTHSGVAQCVFGSSHIAFRLEDGRVCRVSYSLRCDRANSKLDVKRKNGSSRGSSPSGPRDGSNRNINSQYPTRSYRSPLTMLSRTSRGISLLREMHRQGLCLARPQISASEVPESLVEECQAVLEGKSRQLIIRELQHTNLDVNMAVNNLLSRDDEAEQSNTGSGDIGGMGNGEDWDEDSVDILSFFECPDSRMLLDTDGVISDELIEPPTSPRPRSDLPSDYDCGFLSDRRKRRRIYGRTAEIYSSRTFGSSAESSATRGTSDNPQTTTPGVEGGDGNRQNANSTRHCVQLGDQLEFWRGPLEHDEEVRFTTICALHSELVGLSVDGELRQWRWVDSFPFVCNDAKTSCSKRCNVIETWEGIPYDANSRGVTVYYHPRIPSLGLLDDRIAKLSGCITRATVLTASGKFATWVDESLTSSLPLSSQNSSHSSSVHSGLLSFEHKATQFAELRDEIVTELQVAPLITVVRCLSGAVFWWGIYPPYMRQRTIEKSRQYRTGLFSRISVSVGMKSSARPERMSKRSSHAIASGVTPGSFVRMKSAPIFHAGAIGFTVTGGIPKVGTLLEDAWKITDVCRFRVNPLSATAASVNTIFSNPPVECVINTCGTTDDVSQHLLTCPYALNANANSAAGTVSGSYPTQAAGTPSHPSVITSAAASPSVVSGGDQLAGGGGSNLTFQEMPPPPSPASSTCSDQSGPVRVSPGTFKRKKVASNSSDRGDYDLSSRTARGRSADREFQSGTGLITGSSRRISNSADSTIHSDISNKVAAEISAPTNVSQEEDWCLSDVIFVEDGRTQPVGIVLKVDGNIAAVKFLKDQERACLAANCIYSPVCSLVSSIVSGSLSPQSSLSVSTGPAGLSAFANSLSTSALPDPMAWIHDCRLLRKDDLTVVRYAGSSRVPDFVQRTPRRIPGLGHNRGSSVDASRVRVITLSPENNRIHTIVQQDTPQSVQLAYHVYNLSGRMVLSHKLPPAFGMLSGKSNLEKATLTCPSESPVLLRDGFGLVYPFVPSTRSSGGNIAAQDCGSNMVAPLDLPPVQCAAFAWAPGRQGSANSTFAGLTNSSSRGQASKSSDHLQPSRCLLGLVIVRDLPLMQHILRANDLQVERMLSPDNELPMETARKLANEVVDGQRNLLHMAVTMCAPQSNIETSSEWATKLDPVLSGPVQLVPTSAPADLPDDVRRTASTVAPNNSTISRPPSMLWSSITRNTTQSSGLSMHELFIRSSIEAASVAAATADSASGTHQRTEDRDPRPPLANGTNFWHLPPVRKDELTRRVASYRIVRLLLESRQLRPYLIQLLTARNTENLTPFILAVKCRAYTVAQFIYETIQCLSVLPPDCLGLTESELLVNNEPRDLSRDFFFPADSRPDDSPLFLLCYNDTCSFTWTGPDHIRQDIFECRTCGLMDSLCCCTECARVCHRGHDCRLKRTSPTAYCDCWEKCRCQSLVAGAQGPRHELFYHLLRDTELIRMINSRNEHLLLFLVKCVERQLREQKQYRPSRRRITSVSGRSTGASVTTTGTGVVISAQGSFWDNLRDGNQTNSGGASEEPDHDLDPPRFARNALALALGCPIAVYSILSLDSDPCPTPDFCPSKKAAHQDEENLLFAQGGATQLDDFVFTLVCKCPAELADTLVSTINRHMTSPVSGLSGESSGQDNSDRSPSTSSVGFLCHPKNPTPEQMRVAASRFIRSVARIYTCFNLELTADHKKKKNRLTFTQLAPLDVCRHIFSRLAPISLVEIPLLAAGLLTPVRTGTLRPSVPFSLMTQSADAIQGLEQFFAMERSTHSRHKLFQLAEQNRNADTAGNPPDSQSIFTRTTEGNQSNRTQAAVSSQASNRTSSESRGQPMTSSSHSQRTTVISSLHVNLSVPDQPVSNISAAPLDVTRNCPTNASFVSASLNDPSVLTMQMQSTIRDIDRDHDSLPHGRTTEGDTVFTGNVSSLRSSVLQSVDGSQTCSQPQLTAYDDRLGTSSPSVIGAESCSGSEATALDGCERGDTCIAMSRLRRPQLMEAFSTSDNYPKRRRTLGTESGSPTHPTDETSNFPTSQEANMSAPDDDENKGSFVLLETEDPASQASSTGATVATIGGSTMDFDQGSDITNGSMDTVFNNRGDRTITSDFTMNSFSLRPEQVESVPDLPTPVEIVGSGRSDEFAYGELLNSVVNAYQSTLTGSTSTGTTEQQPEDCLHNNARSVRVDYANVDDTSDGQVSDFDEEDDQEDGEEDDAEVNGDDEGEDDETEDEDGDEDGYNDDEAEDLVDGEEDDDDDEENDDDSSHHSDASSNEAGSRSTSPTWGAWSRNSVFPRLSSRGTTSTGASDEASATPVTSSGLSVSNCRMTSVDPSGASSVITSAGNTSTVVSGSQQTSRGPTTGRRGVPSVISLLPSTSASNVTPTLIVSNSGVSSVNVLSSSDSTLVRGLSSENGCTIHTQVQLSRAFGCLMRVIADLIVEMHEELTTTDSLRRCSSVPAALVTGQSGYEHQRRANQYETGSSTNPNGVNPPSLGGINNNGHPLTLLLSSPMASTNLSSANLSTRCFGASLSDYQRTQNAPPTLAHSSSFTSSALTHLSPTLRTVTGTRAVLLSPIQLAEAVAAIGVMLGPIWQWLTHALDNLEAQLRYSAAWNAHFPSKKSSNNSENSASTTGHQNDGVTTSSSSSNRREWRNTSPTNRHGYSRSSGGRSTGASVGGASTGGHRSDEDVHGSLQTFVLGQRHDFLSYVFSIMRATSGDHGDAVPFIGAPMHKHLAYVLDALLYFFKAFESAWPSGVIPLLTESIHNQEANGFRPPAVPPSQGQTYPVVPCTGHEDPLKERTTAIIGSEGSSQLLTGRVAQREDAFFRRSESVLSLSGLGLDLVENALIESLPLALQPHRLHPNATRTDLFGSARFFSGVCEAASLGDQPHFDLPLHMNSPYSVWGCRTAEGGSRVINSMEKLPTNSDVGRLQSTHFTHVNRNQLLTGGGFLDSIGHSATLLSRWCLSLEFFGRHFSNDVGAEHQSYILELGGFTVKEARFRKHMERLRNTERRDLLLEVERDRASLILGTVRQLNAEYNKRQSQVTNHSSTSSSLGTSGTGVSRYSVSYNPVGQHTTSNSHSLRSTSGNSPIAVAFLLGTTTDSPLLGTLFGASPAPTSFSSSGSLNLNQPAVLSCHRVKVTFKDEPGEGSGVARSFFTAFSEAVLSQEDLPQLSTLLTPVSTPVTTNTSGVAQNYTNALFHHRHYTSPNRPYNSTIGSLSRTISNSTTASTSTISASGNNTATMSRTGSPTRVTFSYTPRSLDSSASAPIRIYPQHNSGSRLSGRARTSAWRRAGGLSAQAPPFYPTTNVISLPSPPPPPPRLRRSRSRSPISSGAELLPASPTQAVLPLTTVDSPTSDQNVTSFSPGASPRSQTQCRPEAVPRPLLLRSSLNSTTSTPPGISGNTSRPISPVNREIDQITSATPDSNLDQQSVGNRLFAQVFLLTRSSRLASRITGMLLELPATEHAVLLEHDEALLNRIEEARAVLTMAEAGERDHPTIPEHPLSPQPVTNQQQPILERLVKWRSFTTSVMTSTSHSSDSSTPGIVEVASHIDPERVPLFWQPGVQGYYFPRAVPGTNVSPPVWIEPEKLALRYCLYRGIGRVIGLCLLTNETCPLHLSRPVLKYILGRVLHWHDFAFYDPTTFEGLRQLLLHTLPDQKLDGTVSDYNLTFSLIPSIEEGGISSESTRAATTPISHHLSPQGDEVEVNESNVYEFVKRYTEFKMVEAVREPLEQMRLGVYDILPRNALERLTAEDLRLLLNGAEEIDTDVLASYTTFHNETGTGSTDLSKSIENSGATNSADKVTRLKRWFWSTVRNMDNKQRQDLLYFWTSSPALPASPQGFQPMPSITIRPPDDHHLPSANTCISRLYLPLYSSKQILREKLLQAIEVKSFGFV